MTAEAVEKIIKKDMIDPTNGKKMTDKDIIYIQRVFLYFFLNILIESSYPKFQI